MSYYHEFQPNILGNMWFYLGIAAMLIALFLGFQRFYLVKMHNPDRLKIRSRYKQVFMNVIFWILTIVWTLMLFLESGDGIIQVFDNSLAPYESGVWSLFSAAFAIVCAGGIFFLLLTFIARFGEWLRTNQMSKARKEYYRKQRG